MIILPSLPYEISALEPYISSKTVDFHYNKHHAGYVNNLNKFIQGTEFENMSLLEIVTRSSGKANFVDIFNNAAQVWNHTFYWHSMEKHQNLNSDSESLIPKALLEKILDDFENLQSLKDALIKAAMTQFGSGWAWLVLNKERYKLEVIKTANADTPVLHQKYAPLLSVDVWEHAYYLDYQNQRLNHVNAIVGNILNWGFACDNLVIAQQL